MIAYKRKKGYINFLMLMRVIGYLLSIESLFMLVPLAAALIFQETTIWRYVAAIVITGVSGFGMTLLRPKSRDMGKREAIVLTGMTWIILSLFGMLPFLLCETHTSVTDAFFETMSGFTTTGASVLNSLTNVPRSILLWRCVVQWIGGLGIILFTLAVVPMLNYSGGMQLFNAEVTGITHDKLRPRVSYTAKGLWGVYIALTGILIFLLLFSEMDIFDAICYGLSTMSTGGFATSDLSLQAWDSMYIKILLCIFMLIGGINFSLIYNLLKGQVRSFFTNDALRWYFILIGICFLLLSINLFMNGKVHDISDCTIDPLFQTISILSSTGLTEPDFHDWGAIAVLILIVMMIVGACAGSTSGGAKVDRFIVLFKFLKNEFYKMMHPGAVTTVTFNQKGIPHQVVNKTIAFLFIYAIVIIVGGIILALFGLPVKDSFFCTLSAISNTGLGTDITGIAGNYALVPAGVKWTLSLIMLIGRLEIFTVLLLLTPSFWRK